MSGSLDIVGIFAIKDGKLEAAGRGSRHLVYSSAFAGTDETSIAAQIRTYSPTNMPYHDGTAVFVAGRLNTTRGDRAIIQSHAFCIFPGDPSGAEYEARLPPLYQPIIFAVGKVVSPLTRIHDNQHQFGVETTQYFIDGVKTCITK
jgi:hypothetical protein